MKQIDSPPNTNPCRPGATALFYPKLYAVAALAMAAAFSMGSAAATTMDYLQSMPPPLEKLDTAPQILDFNFHMDGTVTIDGSARTAQSSLIEAFRQLKSGNIDFAISMVDDVIKNYPNYSAAYEVAGTALAIRGNVAAAMAYFRKAVQLDPARATAYTKMGDIHLALGQTNEAKEQFELAISYNPDERRAHQRLGRMYDIAASRERAIFHYEKGLTGVSPDYVGIKVNLGHLYNLGGRYEDTLALFGDLDSTNADPTSRDIIVGDANHGLKQYAKAIALYRKVLTLNPEDVNVRIRLAWSLYGSQDYSAALSIFEELEKKADNSHMVLSGLGATYERMGNLVAAERVYDQLILRYAAQQSTYRRVGLFWGSIKRYGKAIAIFNRGLKEYPNDVVLLRGKRTALQRLGKIKEAVSVAQRIVSLIPKSGSALFYLASLQQDAGLFLLAIENYRAILKINSNHFGTLNNLAVLLTKTGSADQALPYAEKARKLEPERSDTADTLGWTLFRSGQRQQGIEELRRAHNLAPKGAAPLYHLGLAYWEMKNADQAREYLSRAVKQLKTGSRMAKHAQNVLAGMDGP